VKEQYVRYILETYVLEGNFDSNFAKTWVDQHDLEQITENLARLAFQAYGIDPSNRYSDLSTEIISHLIADSVIVREGDDYSGYWYKLRPERKASSIDILHKKNPVVERINKIGEEALRRALVKIVDEDNLWSDVEGEIESPPFDLLEHGDTKLTIPASDRVVSIGHNYATEFDRQTSLLIEQVASLNGIDEGSNLREVVIGQLKAGRELIRAGSFKLYLLQITLIDTLLMLAKRYEKEAIGGLAGALASALIKHFGIEG